MKAGPNLSGTVLKALEVLDFIGHSGEPPNTSEVARACGLTRPTASRLVRTLESRGFVKAHGDGRYGAGNTILRLSGLLLEQMSLPEMARPYMGEVTRACRETTHLGVRDDTNVLYVAKVDSPESVRMHAVVGAGNPLHCTALGKALLAWLPDDELKPLVARLPLPKRTANTITNGEALLAHLEVVRRRGYAVDDVENENGIRCVGAPIFDNRDRVVAAMSFSGPSYRLSIEQALAYAPRLVQSCRSLSADLGSVAAAEVAR